VHPRKRRIRTPDDGPQKQLGVTIRELRLRSELTQEDLADACDLHPTEIGRVERGERDLRLSTIVRVARGLDVAPGALLDDIR
jgi:transcriptional regulator with XRE-family HTH domain